MSDEKLIPFRPKDSRDASARVEIFEDEEELRLLFELPVTDCAIAITFWKDLAGDDGKASVSVWTRGRERHLNDLSINSFRQWARGAIEGKPRRPDQYA
jgi:hypothetical protein